MTDHWQMMDTAPSDGTPILGYDGRDMAVVCWKVDVSPERPPGSGYWSLTVDAQEEGAQLIWWPTHWRPLPPSPCQMTVEAIVNDEVVTRTISLVESSWKQFTYTLRAEEADGLSEASWTP